VINARFAAPVDEKIVSTAVGGKGIITVEDHRTSCGFGSAVLEAVAKSGAKTDRIRLLGVAADFIRHGSRAEQLMQAGIRFAR